ncbi:hypothetical protein L596_026750 [Steinernema carpocapsae]|uniref:Uncharacterized protein n=1 Tax=Steinernema carpocapsae TaxID=34508 RepID=A0A4U5M297_STECR|nr:hypothetical protein L596_026750 [Steinernema carpocapsae]
MSCVFQFTSFGIVKELNTWIYREDTFVRSLEKYSTVSMTRQSGASKTEIRLLMAFLFDFSYVVIVVSSFHILPKFVDYGIITVWIINFFWHLIPFAGGVALLLINK